MSKGRKVEQTLRSIIPTVTVQLGGLEYDVSPIPSARAKQWRDKLLEPFLGVLTIVGGLDKIEINTPADLMRILPYIQEGLIGSVDIVREAVLSYAPDIKEDWDSGDLAEAMDSEFIQALFKILRLAYPLEQIKTMLPQNGRSAPTTPQKLHLVNGASPKKTQPSKAK